MSKIFKFIILVIISAVGLYFAFQGEDFVILWENLLDVEWLTFILAVILLLFSVVVRAKRWQYILEPLEHIPLHPLFSSTMIGYFGNTVLVFRLGELLRAYSIAIGRKLTLAQAFGTVILERVIDAVTVVCILVLLLAWIPVQNPVIQLSIITFIGTTLIVITFIIIVYYWDWLAFFQTYSFFKHGVPKKLLQKIEKIFDGLIIITKSKHIFALFVYSVLLWITYFIMTYCLLEATHLDDIGLIGAGVILAMGSIAIAIPALPGGVGTYDAGIKFSLILFFSVSSEKALAFALVAHASNFFPFLIIGAIYFILGGLRIRDVDQNSIQ
ncbi:MAG: lysylphosphatidylglycerol synthase transmembrane domain-containing protein [Candidatus Neomarinimicrobiota bacterium]|nr:lysylphosphatidylglycerol synthase transmembrane domain-containing protein [Candidatus Neomarinimicrobiota bacterium]